MFMENDFRKTISAKPSPSIRSGWAGRESGRIRGKMVSIRDVAKRAGVAISTVSKVLNDYPNVSDETKKKVN